MPNHCYVPLLERSGVKAQRGANDNGQVKNLPFINNSSEKITLYYNSCLTFFS